MTQEKQTKKLCLYLDEPTTTMLERLLKWYGFKSKSDVIRLAIAQLYQELVVKKVIGDE